MKISYGWLLEHLDTKLSAKEIAQKLSEIGFEVENFEDYSEKYSDIKVAKILEIRKHPSSDKLSICKVDFGLDNHTEVVCGAKNIYVGMLTAIVLEGGFLPSINRRLESAIIRGVKSSGMLCSASELLLDDPEFKNDGIIDIKCDVKIGENFGSALNLDDKIIEIKITPNRGDALSIRGIARDLGVLQSCKFLDKFESISENPILVAESIFEKNKSNNQEKNKEKNFEFMKNNEYEVNFSLKNHDSLNSLEKLKVKINTQACGIYSFALIKNVKNSESPNWLKKKLNSVGQKSINALVDVTNYLMFEFGIPTHVFDFDKIAYENFNSDIEENVKKIKSIVIEDVNNEKNNVENFLALNGEKYLLLEKNELNVKIPVISDSEKILGILGIIGGENSGSDLSTKNVFFECAYFDPKAITIAGQKLNIQTEARKRFERGVDPKIIQFVSEKAMKLINEICGGEVEIFEILLNDEVKMNGINFEKEKIILTEKILKDYSGDDNVTISHADEFLKNLGFGVEKFFDQNNSERNNSEKENSIILSVPSFRHDVFNDKDLVEEVLRIYGYDKLKSSDLPVKQSIGIKFADDCMKRNLTSLGFFEVITLPFLSKEIGEMFSSRSEKLIEVLKPINSSNPFLRTSIIASLIQIVKYNINRNVKFGKFFEIGKIFNDISFDDRKKIESSFQKSNLNNNAFYKNLDGNLFEENVCGGIIFGKNHEKDWRENDRPFDVFDIKNYALSILNEINVFDVSVENSRNNFPKYYHGARLGNFLWNGKCIGFFGEIHPTILQKFEITEKVFAFEINMIDEFDVLLNCDRKNPFKISSLQPIFRDFAFLIDKKVVVSDLIYEIKNSEKMITDVIVFDIFESEKFGSEKKSIALQIKIEPKNKNLTDEDLLKIQNLISENLLKKFNAELRDGC